MLFRSSFQTDLWCRNSKFGHMDHITAEDFQQFRMGDHAEASDETKEKWKFVGIQLMTHVNQEWARKETRLNRTMRSVVSASDEALVAWHFQTHMESEWKDRVKEDLANLERGEQGPKKKRRKKAGVRHAAQEKLCDYFQWKKMFTPRREDKSAESNSWDQALMDAMVAEQEKQTRASEKDADEDSDDDGATETRKKKTSEGALELMKGCEEGLFQFDECKRCQI